MKNFSLLVIIISFCNMSQAYYSTRKAKYFSADLQYHSYTDILNSNTQNQNQTQKLELDDTLGIGFNMRFYRIFSFVIAGFKANSEDRSGFGLGLRVDLPGVLFMGGSANNFVRSYKRQPINTYLQWTKFLIREPGVDQFVADKIGFGADIFLVGSTYLNTEVMTYSHRGNQFLSLGLGFGYEF